MTFVEFLFKLNLSVFVFILFLMLLDSLVDYREGTKPVWIWFPGGVAVLYSLFAWPLLFIIWLWSAF